MNLCWVVRCFTWQMKNAYAVSRLRKKTGYTKKQFYDQAFKIYKEVYHIYYLVSCTTSVPKCKPFRKLHFGTEVIQFSLIALPCVQVLHALWSNKGRITLQNPYKRKSFLSGFPSTVAFDCLYKHLFAFSFLQHRSMSIHARFVMNCWACLSTVKITDM
jgi:hypothetical protein